MSMGQDIPYQLRPNKFIDRQIFIELISRITPQKKAGQYIYISMGGRHLVDHEAVYRRLGIANLYSFDGDPNIVERQECNKPIASAKCVTMMSGSLPGEIDNILQAFEPAGHMILWLDYTRPAERLSQLQEFTECLRKGQPGDLFRITMNADDFTLRGDWKKAGFEGPPQYRADRLKAQIGEFYPEEIKAISENGIPAVLARSVQLACSKAAQGSRLAYTPILNTSYADKQWMFTCSVIVHSVGDPLPTGVLDWEFLPKATSEIIHISVPDLSIREKLLIDRYIDKSPKQIIKSVKFQPSSALDDATEALRSYKKLHRFYPTFMAIGVQ